jgi:quercetin dioxygenase-like cupin family protein
MNSPKTFANVVILCLGLGAAHLRWGFHQVPSSAQTQAKDRARIVLSQQLSRMDGDHLKGVLVEVRYGPGEASSPHTHPCAVIGYVAEGAIRTQVQGEPEMTYQSGQSFYEPPNGVHLISANASATAPAKLIAYLICDREAPLSVDVPDSTHAEGELK